MPHPVVFFTCVTHQRRPLLANIHAHTLLRGLWERSAEQDGWFVGDYILMPDHVHLFARPGFAAESMSAWVGMWKSVSARSLRRAHEVPAPIWQEEYFDRNLRSTESYQQKWEYVRGNPVRAGLVVTPENWPYMGCIHQLHIS